MPYEALDGPQPLEEALAVVVHERAMADLASGPRALAVVVKMCARDREHGLDRRQLAEQIQHRRVAPGSSRAERPAEHGAQVILELARLGALDGPVAGVVDSRRHLVREQSLLRL